MIVAHDFGYYLGVVIGLVIFIGLPVAIIIGVTGFTLRMWPVMLSIWGLFIHGHRRPE